MVNRTVTLTAMALCMTAGSAHARSRTQVSPYLEVDQTVITDLKGGNNDVLTYTNVSAGVDVTITGRRAEVQIDARYEHQFGWSSITPDQDIISGIARGRMSLIRDDLSLEGGALATRTRTDGYSGANNSLINVGDNVSQIYSAYIGPTLSTQVGDLGVNGAYRFGWTKVTDDPGVSIAGFAPNSYDQSTYHSATLSVGMQPGVLLPFGWSVGAGYDREDASELDQRYTDKWVRGDVTLPVTPTVALVGGVGYENIKISQRDALRDTNGDPVITGNGHYVTDKSSPRLLAYDQDGMIWDAGVLWRPSRRTSLEARVGRRYGSMHYVGSFSWQSGRDSSLSVVLFDSVDSFGRRLTSGLASLGTSDLIVERNPFSGDLTGCAYSTTGGGQCFNDTLSGIGGSNFRYRGVAAQYASRIGPWNWGAGLGYSQRKLIAAQGSVIAYLDGRKDQNYYANLFASRKLDDRSGIDTTLYGNYFESGFSNAGDVLNLGGYTSYYRTFGRRLTATASVGVDSVDPKGVDSVISALGQLGLRYQF